MEFKTDWKTDDTVQETDVNRWEGNTKEIYEGLQKTNEKVTEVSGGLNGLIFGVTEDGILTVTYDDGQEG